MSRENESQAWTWLTTYMPDEVDLALAKFVSINPHYNGAAWWDCLDVLIDSDSHLDITEPMAEAMDEWDILRAFITMTLIYASEAFATTFTDRMRVNAVRATILNNRKGGES